MSAQDTRTEQSMDISSRAERIRKGVIEISHSAQTSHIGSSLSCVDILTAVLNLRGFSPVSEDSELVLSKGHAAPALYAALAEFGYLTSTELKSFARPGSMLEEHPNHNINGVSTPSGSLGHGLPFAAGFALASAKDGKPRQAVVVMSDGECNEGTVWESAIFAGARNIGNLIAIVDSNRWQATGRTSESFGNLKIGDLFEAAGWAVRSVDGHNLRELGAALEAGPNSPVGPLCIIANTIKGKGVSFMEDDNNWHYRTLNNEDFGRAMKDLADAE
jgi:transketolase